MKNQFLIGLTFIVSLLIIRPASSQTIDMGMVPDSISTLELDFTRSIGSSSNQKIISGFYDLQYKQVLSHKFNFIGKVGYYYSGNSLGGSIKGFANVYTGIQYKLGNSDHRNSSLNLGVYLPTAEQLVQLAVFYDLYELPKFAYKITDVRLGYSSFHNYDSGFRLGYEVGSDIAIPVGENTNDVEVLARYGLNLMYKFTPEFYAQSELLGIATLTDEGSFDENTFHSYAIGVGYRGNKVGLGVSYKNYFDELFGSSFDGFLGVEFSVFL